MPNPHVPSRCGWRGRALAGFTLLELMIVVVIMGIISVSVIPAMGSLKGMREGGARDDLVRFIEVAKGKAVASGRPYGIRINLADSSLTIVEIDAKGRIQIEFDPLTNANRTINIAALYSGVTISAMTNGNGISGSGIIWFDYESNPHTRSAMGAFVALNATAATITLSSGSRVLIHPYSGTVEVQ